MFTPYFRGSTGQCSIFYKAESRQVRGIKQVLSRNGVWWFENTTPKGFGLCSGCLAPK
jgi:hypothetical protein